jgi:hypothetical protein
MKGIVDLCQELGWRMQPQSYVVPWCRRPRVVADRQPWVTVLNTSLKFAVSKGKKVRPCKCLKLEAKYAVEKLKLS